MVWEHAKNSSERPGIQSRTGAGRKPLDSADIPHNGDCEMLETRHLSKQSIFINATLTSA
jgi:hypothetical protein